MLFADLLSHLVTFLMFILVIFHAYRLSNYDDGANMGISFVDILLLYRRTKRRKTGSLFSTPSTSTPRRMKHMEKFLLGRPLFLISVSILH